MLSRFRRKSVERKKLLSALRPKKDASKLKSKRKSSLSCLTRRRLTFLLLMLTTRLQMPKLFKSLTKRAKRRAKREARVAKRAPRTTT